MKIPNGFIEGGPAEAGCGFDATYIGYALVWPRKVKTINGAWVMDSDRVIRHPQCDGKTPIKVYFTPFGVMLTDGWIGWDWTALIYHPAPVEYNRPITEEQWNAALQSILEQRKAA